jgi:hypothetical protein
MMIGARDGEYRDRPAKPAIRFLKMHHVWQGIEQDIFYVVALV